jgi:C1A family cysteine protease
MFGISSVPNLKQVTLPTVFGLDEFMPPVKDQKDLGACTAFASTVDREAIARQYENKQPILSPLFVYYYSRLLDGSLDEGDAGSTGETTCQVFQRYGACLESEDPYITSDFQKMPFTAQIQAAKEFKSGAYHSLHTVQDVQNCIFSGYRIRLGMNVYQSFENIGSNGLMPIPSHKENVLGGHEILIYRFDNSVKCPNTHSTGAFLVRNSWGSSWGQAGSFWMPYEGIVSSLLNCDLKIQHLGPAWK